MMKEQDFLEQLAELMDTEGELTMDRELSTIEEWDSLSHVAFLALCAGNSQKKVLPQEVKEAKTVRDLYQLMQG